MAAAAKKPDPRGTDLGPDDLRAIHRHMRTAREIEMRAVALYRQGKLFGGVYTGTGNEATSVGMTYALESRDFIVPLHRDLGAHLVKGETPRGVFLQYFGRAEGGCRGKDSGLHQGDVERGTIGMISHLGTMTPVAVGTALACRMQKRDAVVLNFIGEGATSTGDFHEGLNFASVWKVPLVVAIENNQWAYSTPTSRQYACARLSDRAAGYGIPGVTVDGTDIRTVYAAAREAVDRARAGGGPTLIESVTMRMRGHAEHDDAAYVPKGMLDEWGKKDPLDRIEKLLVDEGIATPADLDAVRADVLASIDEAVAHAEAAPLPAGPDTLEGVYA